MLPTFEDVHGHSDRVKEGWWTTLARTVAVDFDGTIHPYTKGWTGSAPEDEPPIEGAREFLEQLHVDGFRVVIFSTRADHVEGKLGIEEWLRRYDLSHYVDDVTHAKPAAIAYVDDRAVVFDGSWVPVRTAIDGLAAGRAHGAAVGAD